ncbi:membrane-bound metal-dependent hydrolase YbcI (DUF457 family) [Arthrobacter sp. GAS37]|uniref:metal-dependent hydrolase n=1 Tax=Arthrobacter sp. GAS37 TaxID=3156261 RepID=UPI0038342FBD
MMGAHHAACGAAAWLAVTTRVHIDLASVTGGSLPWAGDLGSGLMPVSPGLALVGAVVCAGAAMLPDADHSEATIAHSLPPLSNVVCAGVGAVSGGHRHGTHSILGIAVFTMLAWVASLWTIPFHGFGNVHVGEGLAAMILGAFAAKALKIIPDSMRRTPWLTGALFGALIALLPTLAPVHGPQWWFPAAVALGAVVHILGDMLTTGGVNLIWPFVARPPKPVTRIPALEKVWMPNGYMAVPVLGNAGSWREWCFLVPIAAYSLYTAAVTAWALRPAPFWF